MNFNEQQKGYISNLSKELIGAVHNYLLSVSVSESLPSEHYVPASLDPNPELFWGEHYHFGINLCFPPSKSRHVFMYLEVILWDKFVKVSIGIADEDMVNLLPRLEQESIYQELENGIFNLIEKAESQ